MKLRKNVPKVCDENYPLNFREQTTIIELSFINHYLLTQIRMPMVVELPDRDELVTCSLYGDVRFFTQKDTFE